MYHIFGGYFIIYKQILKIIELDIKGTHPFKWRQAIGTQWDIMFWYTIRRINKMCHGISTGAVWWLAYEMVEKSNTEDNAL